MPENDRLICCVDDLNVDSVEREATPKLLMMLSIQLHLAGLSSSDTVSFLEILAVAIGVVVPLVLAALGVDSLTVGIPDTLLFVFGFLRTPDGGVEFSMGSGVFLVGGAVGIVYAYLRTRRRSA